MKTSVLKITAILLIVVGGFTACNRLEPEEVLPEGVRKGHFFVSTSIPNECGYLLFVDTGNPGHFHNNFMWAENLPEEFQIEGLRVTVTFRIVKERNPIIEEGIITGCYFPIINIIKIRKR